MRNHPKSPETIKINPKLPKLATISPTPPEPTPLLQRAKSCQFLLCFSAVQLLLLLLSIFLKLKKL